MFGSEIEFQQLRVTFEDGSFSEEIYNDYTPVSVGDTVYVRPGYNQETGQEGYYVHEIDRTKSLFWIFVIFVGVYLLVAGIRGLRSLVALAVAVLSVWFVLIPLIMAGYNPLVVGTGISIIILGFAIFITHGMTVVSVASYVGSIASIIIAMGFASLAVSWANISGLVGDENSTISVLYGSQIDLKGLLLAAMIIGILGVLDDVAVMQAAMVREFMREKTHTFWEIFIKSMRIGQEHAAALVNTLVLAYTAVALPLFLIVLSPVNTQSNQSIPLSMHLSNELFEIEFIRSAVGSLGLVITIPTVSALAMVLFRRFPPHTPSSHQTHHSH